MAEEVIPWCRPCEQFHQESTCYVANQVMEHGLLEFSNRETNSSEPDHVYMVGQAYPCHRLNSTNLRMKPLQNLIVKLMMKTVIYMMGLLCVLHMMMTVWKVYCLVTFSLNKMSMKMRTSIAWSMIQVMKTPLSLIKMLIGILAKMFSIFPLENIPSLGKGLIGISTSPASLIWNSWFSILLNSGIK